ncbi:OmpA family protein [Thiomicrospira microaerophila]|uniref:OmpA family protein n=1 Tax=Thiomicrospira microaerophila TaxID=406020 RepID=UPI000697471A|nr:OmpA family protein [Thiomicrospira microaerophila]
MGTKLKMAMASCLVFGVSQVQASNNIPHQGNNAYVWDSYGSIVRDQFGGCVRTIEWTKEKAIAQCEGWPEPEVRVATPAPVAAPIPVVAPAPVAAPAPMPVVDPAPAPVAEKLSVERPAAFIGFFATKSDVLSNLDLIKLDAYIEYMSAYPTRQLVVIGHTDNRGTADYNQGLSEKRALAVKNYMTGKGISAERITTKGKGFTQPIADNSTAQGRADNRRVELTLVDKK